MINEEYTTSQSSQSEIDQVLIRLQQKGIGKSTKPVLGVDQLAMMKGRNQGYPKDLYHAHHEPRVALNDEMEQMLISQGYGPRYIEHRFPKMLFRRNYSGKFAAPISGTGECDRPSGTPAPWVDEFVETRRVNSEAAEQVLMKQRVPNNCSQWIDSRIALDEKYPMADADENPNVKIAQLEGALQELRQQAKDAEAKAASTSGEEKHVAPPMSNPKDHQGKAVGEGFGQNRSNK